jgi:hypothetical protein
MNIWAMPESQKLEAQTLDKLALAPWNLPREGTNTAAIVATNANSLLLRPLLEDLVQEECYLEIRAGSSGRAATGPQGAPGSLPSGGTNMVPGPGRTAGSTAGSSTLPSPGSTEIALAIRIDDTRSRLWKTNLTAVLDSLTNHTALRPTFLRTVNWTVVAFLPLPAGEGRPALRSASDKGGGEGDRGTHTAANPPLGQDDWVAQLTSKLGQDNNFFTADETNTWLNTELDLIALSSALGLGWNLPAETPNISLTMAGEGDLVRTTARLKFEKPLPLNLEDWNIPTNLVHDPLTSFTAIRGIKSLLSSNKNWNTLQLGPPPNQLYFWAQGNLPVTTFWAAPLPDASNHIYQLTEHLIQNANPWLATNAMGQFQRTTNANAVIWGGLPFMEPYLRSVTLPEGDFIMGGVGASPSTNRPVPPGLFEQFRPRTNIVYYDWELTGARIEAALHNIQFLRFVFQKAQVPPESSSITWLKAVEAKLANSATMVALTRPDSLSFVRRSSVGFTALELHILADWLESPQFPNGLTTFVAEPPPPPLHRHHTNSVALPPQDK